MINQRIEMKLPDETILIAEATEKSDYPSINIYHKDAVGEVDEVVFAEYNPEKKPAASLWLQPNNVSLNIKTLIGKSYKCFEGGAAEDEA